ncbi:MAG TPA: serine/threonine-protein kinase [Gemmataceae bacterium]|nr:serine/threonine-protein kinase [Gemmataceae bacterium]
MEETSPPPVTEQQETEAPEGFQTTEPGPGAKKAGAPAQGSGAGPASASKLKVAALGEFRLVQKLGAGGMGIVYKAQQTSLDREVALKVLSKHLAENPDFVQRFQREARLMARLDHPNILRGFAVGEEKGFHYFAMEYVDGGSMEGWLKRLGKLNVGDALHVVITCARALQYAHEQGLIHRDIKPDNILLTRKGQVKVADLGLAKALTEDVSLTRTGTAAGTPVYMSPEQGRDVKHVDGRSDIYSLGCMLYCFLTGHPPFAGETYVELLEAKEKGQHPPARRFNDDVPSRLDLFIDKMILNNVKMRYQTCAEVIKDLESLELASDTLSFLKAESTEAETAGTGPKKGGPKSGASTPTKGPGRTAFGKTLAEARGETEGDFWFLTYKARDGRPLTRKMSTEQVLDLIKDENFDMKTLASRTREEGYRSLASWREFEAAVRGRLMKARADRKTVQFHKMYEKIEKEVVSRERWRWFGNVFRTGVGWIGLLIWLAILAALAVGAFFLIKFLINFLGKKFELTS